MVSLILIALLIVFVIVLLSVLGSGANTQSARSSYQSHDYFSIPNASNQPMLDEDMRKIAMLDWRRNLTNPANPLSPLNPANPLNPNNPANPNSRLNPFSPMNPNSPINRRR